jgi:chromosome segregation ATPase
MRELMEELESDEKLLEELREDERRLAEDIIQKKLAAKNAEIQALKRNTVQNVSMSRQEDIESLRAKLEERKQAYNEARMKKEHLEREQAEVDNDLHSLEKELEQDRTNRDATDFIRNLCQGIDNLEKIQTDMRRPRTRIEANEKDLHKLQEEYNFFTDLHRRVLETEFGTLVESREATLAELAELGFSLELSAQDGTVVRKEIETLLDKASEVSRNLDRTKQEMALIRGKARELQKQRTEKQHKLREYELHLEDLRLKEMAVQQYQDLLAQYLSTLIRFHKRKFKDVNKHIGLYWKQIASRNSAIETIRVKIDAIESRSSQKLGDRYNYRVR